MKGPRPSCPSMCASLFMEESSLSGGGEEIGTTGAVVLLTVRTLYMEQRLSHVARLAILLYG